MSADYAEFNQPRLAEVYDSFCPLGRDSDFFVSEIKKLKPTTVLDVGCGSGILTVELSKIASNTIGVEPAVPMLAIARERSGGDAVKWISGFATDVVNVQADAILMTSHVAQFLLGDDEWRSALIHLHSLLNIGGKFIFDSRNPLVKAWLSWGKEKTHRVAMTPHGKVVMWYELTSTELNRVQYKIHYLFDSGEELISNNELIYRSKDELVNSLKEASFEVEQIYGDWDRTAANEASDELIFVARKN